MANRVTDGLIQAYSVLLTVALGLVTSCLGMAVIAGMSLFMVIFISLLIASAWQAALPKLQQSFTKHGRDSFMLLWGSVRDQLLDYLEFGMKKLNGKGRLFQGSGKIVFELDDQACAAFAVASSHVHACSETLQTAPTSLAHC